MLEIAGGILLAVAVIGFVLTLIFNPGSVWGAIKVAGVLACAAFVVLLIAVQMGG